MTNYSPLSSPEDRRENFRLTYPQDYAPIILLGGKVFNVKDISEKGLRFEKDWLGKFLPNQFVRATLVFPGGDRLELSGIIVRIKEFDVALLLVKRIPYQKILNEQMIMRQRNT